MYVLQKDSYATPTCKLIFDFITLCCIHITMIPVLNLCTIGLPPAICGQYSAVPLNAFYSTLEKALTSSVVRYVHYVQ